MQTSPRTFRTEFPDFDDAASCDRLTALGWEDISWVNDGCPIFTKGGLTIHVDFAAPERREHECPYQFTLQRESGSSLIDCGHIGDYASLDETLQVAAIA